MKYTFILLPVAKRDVDDIYDEYERKRTGLGDKFLSELQDKFDRILDNPAAFSFSEQRTRNRKVVMKIFPYVIYFVFYVQQDTIVVEAVLHKRQLK